MNYNWFKTELKLNSFQIGVIEYGIRLQRTMWNFLVENVNVEVDNKIIKIHESSQYLERKLREKFHNEIKKSGLSLRIVRSITERYIEAWRRCFNVADTEPPTFHSRYRNRQSLFFIDTRTQILNNTYNLPLYRSSAFGVKNHIKNEDVKLQLKEKSDKFLIKFINPKPKQSCILREYGKYFLCVNYIHEGRREIRISQNGQIGMDWGVSNLFTDSNGKIYNYPTKAKKQMKRIQRLEKVLFKKQKDSNNYKKVQNKIRKAWYRLMNINKDWTEKVVLKLCKENNFIGLETLDLIGLYQKSDKFLKQQMQFNRLSLFKTRLQQKSLTFENCIVYSIDQWFPSSQICSNCGENTGKKQLKVREFICPYCGVSHNRDINAAKNILNKALEDYNSKKTNKNK